MKLPTPIGWSDRRTRTVSLNCWLAREDAVAAGTAAALDPELLGLPDRETLLRALFQRWTTTLEGVLDALDDDADAGAGAGAESGARAVRAAFHRAAAHRPRDWRALVRESSDPLVAGLTRSQHERIARRVGISVAEVGRVAAATAAVTQGADHLPQARRRRALSRALIRRATA